uniref:uncharacterized transcriptional regulatory protein YLR278C-like n=1 Tax=Styela clava TaxID=7725 RepID=UPI00193A3DE4|nr:uncharacterized transcriptional regulatory protein YLR278C-like [Styela clava]
MPYKCKHFKSMCISASCICCPFFLLVLLALLAGIFDDGGLRTATYVVFVIVSVSRRVQESYQERRNTVPDPENSNENQMSYSMATSSISTFSTSSSSRSLSSLSNSVSSSLNLYDLQSHNGTHVTPQIENNDAIRTNNEDDSLQQTTTIVDHCFMKEPGTPLSYDGNESSFATSSFNNSVNSLAINSCSSSLNLYDPPPNDDTYVTPHVKNNDATIENDVNESLHKTSITTRPCMHVPEPVCLYEDSSCLEQERRCEITSSKDNCPSMSPPPYCLFVKSCIEDIRFKETPESVSTEERQIECSVSRTSDKDPPCYEVAMSM